MLRRAILIIVIAVTSAASGCGTKLVPLHGKVVYPNGMPMTGGGRMVLMPEDPTGTSAVGFIRTDGTFTAYTLKPDPPDGVLPGAYRVGITGNQESPGAPSPHVDEKYADPTMTDLRIEAKPGAGEVVITVTKPGGRSPLVGR